MRLFLDKGADVNAQSGRALRKALENGLIAVMEMLLKKNKEDISLIFHDDGKALQGISVDDPEAVDTSAAELWSEPLWVSSDPFRKVPGS